MATKVHGKGTRVFVDGYNWSTALNQASLAGARDVVEDTTFADAAKTYKAGLQTFTLSVTGFGDFDDNGVDELKFGHLTNDDRPEVSILKGSSGGDEAYSFYNCIPTGDNMDLPSTGIVGFSQPFSSDNAARCAVLNYETAITTTGAQTGFEFDAGSSGDVMVLAWHITAVNGSGTIAFKLEESSDSTDGTDGTWGDVESIATGNLTAVGGGWNTGTLTGSVGTWYRINVTTFSTFTSVTVTALAGFRAS